MQIGYEPALSPYRHAEAAHAGSRIPLALVDEAERQLDAFAEVLARLGIVVRRSDSVGHAVAFRTPDWEAACGRANACPRDQQFVVGDQIIEAPMTLRARFFE